MEDNRVMRTSDTRDAEVYAAMTSARVERGLEIDYMPTYDHLKSRRHIREALRRGTRRG